MIALDSPRWRELRDAYGPADDIPAVLRELETDDEAISKLYDAFALIDRGAITDAAYAVLPHLWRLAESRDPVDRYHLVQLASRVAYCALDGVHSIAPDIVADGAAALAQFLATARALLSEVDEADVLDVAEAVLALARCGVMYEVVESLQGGSVTVVCPGDTCGVEISLEPRDAQLVAVVDDLETDVERAPLSAYDPDGPWTDADALPRLADALAAAGCPDLAQQIALLGGNVLCPKCGEMLSVRHELLYPSEP